MKKFERVVFTTLMFFVVGDAIASLLSETYASFYGNLKSLPDYLTLYLPMILMIAFYLEYFRRVRREKNVKPLVLMQACLFGVMGIVITVPFFGAVAVGLTPVAIIYKFLILSGQSYALLVVMGLSFTALNLLLGYRQFAKNMTT